MNDMSGSKYVPFTMREHGGNDARIALVAVVIWVSMLGCHGVLEHVHPNMVASTTQSSANGAYVNGSEWGGLAVAVLAALICGVVAIAIMHAVKHRVKQPLFSLGWTSGRRISCVAWWFGVIPCCVMLAVMSCGFADLALMHDPAMQAATSGSEDVVAVVKVSTPVTESQSWESDCQADATIEEVGRQGVSLSSNARVRLMLSAPDCTRVSAGETVRVSGSLERSRYGAIPLWLTINKDAAVQVVKTASAPHRAIGVMQNAFVEATKQLSDQGQVLVPGLTIGVLGQDFIASAPEDGSQDVDSTFAATLKQNFKRSGIMHLMAVSGGHFALVLSMVQAVCAALLLPRQLVVFISALAYMALGAAMYPSDSVLRALAMGLFSLIALWFGRRPQPLNNLGWTVCIVLLVDPSYSRSFGFALSCAAVAGIVLCSNAVATAMSGWVPGKLVDGLSVTVCAQAFTLPIQVLMTPQLPLLSLPANLVVAPFVDFSTLTGLAALSISWCCRPLGHVLVWLSSCGTAVMQWCANWAGSVQHAVLPWSGGVQGAVLMLILEVSLVLLYKAIRGFIACLRKNSSDTEGVLASGSLFTPKTWVRGSFWFKETKQLIESMHWSG